MVTRNRLSPGDLTQLGPGDRDGDGATDVQEFLIGSAPDNTDTAEGQTAELEGGDNLDLFPSQYVIGTFTADAVIQPVSLIASTGAGVMYSAIMVRQTSGVVPDLRLTGVTQTGPNTFEISWSGGSGPVDIQASTDGDPNQDGSGWVTIANGQAASPVTVAADPGTTPFQLFRVVTP